MEHNAIFWTVSFYLLNLFVAVKLEQSYAEELKKVQVDNSHVTQEVMDMKEQLWHLTKERSTLQEFNTDLNHKIKQLAEEKATIEKEKLEAIAQVETLASENTALMGEYHKIVSEAEKNFSEKVEMERSHNALEPKVTTLAFPCSAAFCVMSLG